MKYVEALQMRKNAASDKPPEETEDWKKVRLGLNELLGTPKDVVQFVSDPSIPTKHILPYAKAVLGWEPHLAETGQLDMYFNRKGKPLGYALPGASGIYSDATEERLKRAILVARLLRTDPKLKGLI